MLLCCQTCWSFSSKPAAVRLPAFRYLRGSPSNLPAPIFSSSHSRGQDNRLPPRSLSLDFTMTQDLFGHSTLHTNGKFTHCLRSSGAPQLDGTRNNAARIKNNHYRRIYAALPDPVVFMPVAASTSGWLNEESVRMLFLHSNRDASALAGESISLASFEFLLWIISWVLLV